MLEEKIIEMLEKMESLTVSLAEPTVDLILLAARLEAASGLFIGVVLALLVLVWYKWAYKPYSALGVDTSDTHDNIMFVTSIIVMLLGLVSFLCLLNFWSYVGIFYPEVYLVHKLIG